MTVIAVVVVVYVYSSRRYTPAIRCILAAALLLPIPKPHTSCIYVPTAVVVVVVGGGGGGDLYGASTTHCLVRQLPS